MKVYLDDVRRAPVGWTRVKNYETCVAKLRTGKVEALSLDHDLAEEHYEFDDAPNYHAYREKTGMHVVDWMVENSVWPKEIILHTMNPVGRENMRRSIERNAPAGTTLEIRIGWRG